jgi:hypothetical protein
MITARADDERLPATHSCGEYFCECGRTMQMMTHDGAQYCASIGCLSPEELCGNDNLCGSNQSQGNTCEVVTLDTYLYTGDTPASRCPYARKCGCTESPTTDGHRSGYTVLNHAADGQGQQCFRFPEPCSATSGAVSCATGVVHADDEGNAEFLNKCVVDDHYTGAFHCSCMHPSYASSADGWNCLVTARPTEEPKRGVELGEYVEA